MVTNATGEASISAAFLWSHNVIYLVYDKDKGPRRMRIMDFATSVCKKAEEEWIKRVETFLITVSFGSYIFWCFDKNLPLASEMAQESLEPKYPDEHFHSR